MGIAENRTRKAYVMAELLHKAGATAAVAAAATPEMKAMCGKGAQLILGTNQAKAPSDETWKLTVMNLRHMEEVATDGAGHGHITHQPGNERGCKMTDTFIVTYPLGGGHPYCYSRVEAPNETELRLALNRKLGPNQWARVYDSAEAAGVERHGLTEIPLDLS